MYRVIKDFCNADCRECYRENCITGVSYLDAKIGDKYVSHREASRILNRCAYCNAPLTQESNVLSL